MQSITRIKVTGLFGYMDHEISFSKTSPITIITGPNGTGKTNLLRLLRAVISFDLRALADIDFASFEITLLNRRAVRVRPSLSEGKLIGFRFEGRIPPARKYDTFLVPYSGEEDRPQNIPPYLINLPDGTWFDTRLDRQIPEGVIARRYDISRKKVKSSALAGSWIGDFLHEAKAVLIDTQRLDTVPVHRSELDVKHGRGTANRIELYIALIAAQLSEARRASLDESMNADQTFAARVLKKAKATINERDLKARYQRIADQQAELHASGLRVGAVDVEFPSERTTPTERRILNVFLDDWENKLQPLLPTHEKLKTLRRIVESKFVGKEMILTQRGYVRFVSKYDQRFVKVDSLSSGEQHLLAMFTMLLFSASRGTIVLIDEPEISMHAAWKHSFLPDIAEVASLTGLQIVIATHSSAIINGQWEIVKEIEPPEIPDAEEVEDDVAHYLDDVDI